MMLKRTAELWFVAGFILILWARSAGAQPIKSSDLIEHAQQHDGARIEFEGEVVGDVMRRGSNAWVNVFDGENAVGVWLPAQAAGVILHEGSYSMSGDRVAVTGMFNRACREHSGDFDIHAESVRVIVPGQVVIHRLDADKQKLAFILFGLMGILWIFTRLKRR